MFRKKEEVLVLPSGAKALRDSVNDLKAPRRRRSSQMQAKRFTRSKAGNFFYFAFIIAAGESKETLAEKAVPSHKAICSAIFKGKP